MIHQQTDLLRRGLRFIIFQSSKPSVPSSFLGVIKILQLFNSSTPFAYDEYYKLQMRCGCKLLE
jgi:hypothetical protein